MTERAGTPEEVQKLPPLVVGLLPGWPTRSSVATKAEPEPKGVVYPDTDARKGEGDGDEG